MGLNRGQVDFLFFSAKNKPVSFNLCFKHKVFDFLNVFHLVLCSEFP